MVHCVVTFAIRFTAVTMSDSLSDKLIARLRDGTPRDKLHAAFTMWTCEFESARHAIPWLIAALRSVDLEQQPLDRFESNLLIFGARALRSQYGMAWLMDLAATPEACAIQDQILQMLASDHPELKHEILLELSALGPAAAVFMPRMFEIAAGSSDGYPDSARAKALHAIHLLAPPAAFRPEFAEARRDYVARCRSWAQVHIDDGKAAVAEKLLQSADALADRSEPTPELSSDELVARLRHVAAPRRAMAVLDMLTCDFESAKPAIPALLELMRQLGFELQPLDRWGDGIARFGPAALAHFYELARTVGAGHLPEAQAVWEELVRSAQSPHREAAHIAIHRLGELGAAASAALGALCPIARGPSDGGPMPTRARALLAIHRIDPSRARDVEFDEARRELIAACHRWADESVAAGNTSCATEWTEMARIFSS